MALAQTGHPVNTGRWGLLNPYYCWCSKKKHQQQQPGTYCLSLIKPNTENLAFNCHEKWNERWSIFIIQCHYLFIIRCHLLNKVHLNFSSFLVRCFSWLVITHLCCCPGHSWWALDGFYLQDVVRVENWHKQNTKYSQNKFLGGFSC